MNKINKILFITLSNIGDCILTLPALDYIMCNFKESEITVIAGPRTKEIFQNNTNINNLIIYDKHSSLKEKKELFQKLKREKFDLIIDLRNTLFGALLPAKFKTSPFLSIPKYIKHMHQRHLYRAMRALQKGVTLPKVIKEEFLSSSIPDKEYIDNILAKYGVNRDDKIVVVSPGARSHIKRWPKEKFLKLIPFLMEELKAKVVFVGDKDDVSINKYICEHLKYPLLDLSAKTNIAQLSYLLAKAKLLVTNDSAVLHIASYLNTPVVAIFGPTDEIKYGPWSQQSRIVKKELFCRPCQKAECRLGTKECLEIIKIEDVLRQLKSILVLHSSFDSTQGASRRTLSSVEVPSHPVSSVKNNFKRILIVRTDRIGDVLLSTPVIRALRENYPYAYIAMMVSPYAKEIVENNPYLDEVIVYDKDNRQKSWINSIKFALGVKKKRFDLAVILHPTNRVHLVTYFAGIPKRLGYDRKLGFLLSDSIKHNKQLGQKHELEYTLDILKYLGIQSKDKNIFIPIKPESEKWAEELFLQEGIDKYDKLLAIHPGASCPSKIWPQDRFAKIADQLIEKYGFKVLIIAGPKDIASAKIVCKNMKHPAVDLAGKTSVSQLASVLKKCQLFISNDSGPVHIASAVGTPVISIFGRNQKGLSPKRWGPVGKKDRVLHKEVGCIQCLAHNCVKEFACLKAITVEDVMNVADSILKG
jgi:heptosyltransferase-2